MADANEPVTRSNEDNSSPDVVIPADTHETVETAPIQDPPSGASSDNPTTVENPTPQLDSSAPPADILQPLPPQLPRWMNPPPKLHVPERSDYSHLEFNWKVNPASYLTPMDNTFVDYNILLDGHSHTTYSDGRMKPEQLDHNTIEGALEAQKIANEKYKNQITVIPGMEYRIHMQFIGIQSNPFGPFNKPRPTNEELKKMIDEVHEMGGLVTVNHIPWNVHHPSEGAYAWTLLKAANRTVEGIMSALKGKATSFLFDATGTRPRYYPAENKEYLALLPITALANAFTSFYDDYRGMYSFQ
ncbi:15136_t:CDS:2, partial [Racocetra fulgida]